LRGVPAGIRPGRTQDVAGQAVPMDPGAQQVIFFVEELTGPRRRRISKYSTTESVSLA